MRGLILVGGLGTQLRPLTLTKPKALIEFGNKPLLLHLIELLVRAGVDHIVLAINYKPAIMRDFLDANQDRYGVKITCCEETEPLGTAGPIALAVSQGLLERDEPFFVMNCDVACDFNLRSLYDFHMAHGKLATIMVNRVDEPAKYGKSVVLAHQTGLVERFVEHGRTFAGNVINAGVYIFSPAIFDRIALRTTSMEKEVLPLLASEEQLYCIPLDGYWMNVKQPRDFLQGHTLYLRHLASKQGGTAGDSASSTLVTDRPDDTEGPVKIDPTATIGPNCLIGPEVTVGPGVIIEEGVRLQRCILLDRVRVCAHAVVLDSILGWGSRLGCWSRVENVSVLGENVQIDDELFINGALILPHKAICKSIPEPAIIM